MILKVLSNFRGKQRAVRWMLSICLVISIASGRSVPEQAPPLLSALTSLPSFQSSLDSCSSLLQNMTNYFIEYRDTLYTMYRNSGKEFNDLGRYKDCTNLTGEFRYVLASIPDVLPTEISMGLCVPYVCTVQDLDQFKPFFVQVINNMLMEFFSDVVGYDPDVTVNTGDLYFADSKVLNDEATQASTGTVFFTLLWIIFAIAVIFASFILHKRLAEERAREKERTKHQGNSGSSQPAPSKAETLSSSSSGGGGGGSKQKKKKRKRESCSDKLIRAFSIQENMNKLFTRRAPPEDANLEVLNGIRVIVLGLVILGNTYMYILVGPLQNPVIIQEWIDSLAFSLVLSGDLAVDIFFWLTAFLACYFLLNKMHDNGGEYGSTAKFICNRYMRLFPMYFFMLFFFWKFIVIFGGDGPMFFQFPDAIGCSKTWFWHFFYLNNVVPWQAMDYCMSWTWYLANDFQFYLTVPLLVSFYYRKRKVFYVTVFTAIFLCAVIEMMVVMSNSLSPSFLAYQDEYWSLYYVKPYSRYNQFLIGVLCGALYYSYQREWEVPSCFTNTLASMRKSTSMTLLSIISGIILMVCMVLLLHSLNNSPSDSSALANMLFLVFGRPLFIIGFSLFALPLILGCQFTRPLGSVLAHHFWVPFARLSYGAYLCNEIFMMFKDYNTERGQWACSFDAVLLFLAFFTFSFLFSFLISVFVEMPCLSLWYELANKPVAREEDVYSHSKSAKSGRKLHDATGGSELSKQSLLEDMSEQVKKEVAAAGGGKRTASIDTEDLEEEFKESNDGANASIQKND